MTKLVMTFAVLGAVALGCGKDDGPAGPAKQANGSPVAVAFDSFTGTGAERGVKATLHNYGDKTAVGYAVLAQYYDADDKLMKVKPGTPFEKDTDFTSLSGLKYKCEAGKSATIEINMLAVPEGASRAELMVSRVSSLSGDGSSVEDWWSQDEWNEWPEAE